MGRYSMVIIPATLLARPAAIGNRRRVVFAVGHFRLQFIIGFNAAVGQGPVKRDGEPIADAGIRVDPDVYRTRLPASLLEPLALDFNWLLFYVHKLLELHCQVAQLVERSAVNGRVAGSFPALAANFTLP